MTVFVFIMGFLAGVVFCAVLINILQSKGRWH